MKDMKNDLDRYSCRIYTYAYLNQFDSATDDMNTSRRIFNANAGPSWEGRFLHHAIELGAEYGCNDHLLEFLMYYGADPTIKIDQSGIGDWPAYFVGFDGFDAVQLARALLPLSEDHSIMRLLKRERRPVDLYELGVVSKPMAQQIGPVPRAPRGPGFVMLALSTLGTLLVAHASHL